MDAWTDTNDSGAQENQKTYLITTNLSEGTLIDYAARLRKRVRQESHPAAVAPLFDELDRALFELLVKLKASNLCHHDLHADNIGLWRVHGALEARAIDWEFATVGEACEASKYDALLSNFPKGLLPYLQRTAGLFSKQAVALLKAEKPWVAPLAEEADEAGEDDAPPFAPPKRSRTPLGNLQSRFADAS